jgi:hypothetical protein
MSEANETLGFCRESNPSLKVTNNVLLAFSERSCDPTIPRDTLVSLALPRL